MRFEKLTIQNINSWKGQHTFNFEEILKGEDLFAITGPTGSGKSTVLLSLSLALYGRGPKGLDAQDYISLGQEEASVELNSTIRGRKIRAQWTIQKGKTPKRNVWIDEKAVSKPKTAIEELIGLNFDQFSKTIILNQGEFSRFLTSTFTERKEILEHLSGINELSSLLDQLKHKRQLINQEWEIVYNQIESLPKDQFANIEEILENQKNNDQKIEINEKQQSESDKLNKAIKSYLEFSHAELKIIDKINKQDVLLKELHPLISSSKNAYDNSLIEQSKLNDKSNELRPIFERGLIIENNLTLKVQNQNSIQEKLHKSKNTFQQLEIVFTERNNKLTYLKSELKQTLSPLTPLSDYDKTECSLCFNQIKEKVLEMQYLKNQIQTIDTQKKKIENELKNSDKKLSDLSLSIVKLNPDGQSLEEIKLLHQNLANNDREATRLKNEIKTKKEKLSIDKQNQQKILNEFEKLTKEFQDFSKKNKKSQLEQAIKLCYEASIEAGHCLICGHDQLPHNHQTIENWVEISSESFNEETLKNTEIQVLTSKERVTNLQHEINSLEINFHALPNDGKNDLNELANKLKQLEEIDRLILTLQSMIPLHKKQLEKSNVDLDENLSKQKLIDKSIDLLFNKINKHITVPNIENLLKNWDDWQNSENKRQKLQLEVVQLESQVQQNIEQREVLSEQIAQIQIEQFNLIEQVSTLKKELFSISKGRSVKECQIELDSEIQKFAQEHSAIEKNWRDLTHKREMEANTHSILSNDLKACQIDVINSKTKITKISEEVSQHFDLNNEMINLTKLLAPQEQWNSEIISEIYQLKLLPFLEQLKTSYELMAENRGKYKSQIEEYKKFEKYFSELTEKFKKVNQQKDIYEELYQLMVKGDFRGFALSFIEESLVTLANHELDLLCGGRYRLIQQKDSSKSQVDFMIIDSLNGGEARKISTLSGGETFMISLGLAMALSEMMRGKTEIDSFFIDEGFGALDPDSIEEVLEILFNVQMRGKTIGLISHVKSLTSRIPINIELFKNQYGHSDFRIHKN